MHVSHRMHSELKRYPFSLGNLSACGALLFVRWRADLPGLYLQAFPVHLHSCVWILLRVPPPSSGLWDASDSGPLSWSQDGVETPKSAVGYSGIRSLKSVSLVNNIHCLWCIKLCDHHIFIVYKRKLWNIRPTELWNLMPKESSQ